MPLPTPEGETREAFIQRCMSDEEMAAEYPEADQRYSVCQGLWSDNRQTTTDNP